MTEAYKKFEKIMKRCEVMNNYYSESKSNEELKTLPQDVLRSSVVLSVAGLDTYVTDVFLEFFIPFIKNNEPNEESIKMLQKGGFDTKLAISLLKEENPYLILKEIVEKHYSTYTTQKFEVINGVFKIYSITNIVDNAIAKETKNYPIEKKMIEKYIQRRHQIVHDGDYKDHKIQSINKEFVDLGIKNISFLVKGIDSILERRFQRII